MNTTDNKANLTIEDLQNKCAHLEQHVSELTAKVNWFEEQFRLSQHRQFGASSEKTSSEQQQLFNEAEVTAKPDLVEPPIEEITYRRRKKEGHREEQLKDLPVEIIEYRLPPEGQACSCCGNAMHEMSKQIRRELKIIPATIKVIEQVQYVYSCRHCERNEIKTPIVTAAMPTPVLPGSFVSPSLMAHTMTQKYCASMPLYRQEQQWARLGIDISRQTMSNWMIQAAKRHLKHLYNRMHQHLIVLDILYADETTLQVLQEVGRSAVKDSYMWLYRSGREGPLIVLYEYQTTRAGKHPRRFLEGFNGYLHVDGYGGYNDIPGVTLVGCWAHARRYFVDALKALPKKQQGNTLTVAEEGLAFCNQLFEIERNLSEVSPEKRYEVRLKDSATVLVAFSAWLKMQTPRVLPKSALGKAIQYCRNQWGKLNVFLQDGRLELDNNRSERSIKPFVIGRKNWLFSNSPKGAEASAIIYSIIETAKENQLNPYQYLTYILEKLPNVDVTNVHILDDLLPWSPNLPDTCRVPNKS